MTSKPCRIPSACRARSPDRLCRDCASINLRAGLPRWRPPPVAAPEMPARHKVCGHVPDATHAERDAILRHALARRPSLYLGDVP